MSLFDRTGLQKQELITGSKSRSAIEAARGLSLRERRYLLQAVNSHPDNLTAVSPKGRIRWGRMVCEELTDHFDLGPDKPEPDEPVFLVTLCDLRCCTSHRDKNIDVSGFIRILRRGLRGLSYLGMLEPAYYVNLCKGTHAYGKRMVSWHLHLIAWGEAQRKLAKRITRLNDEGILLPIADGLPAADQRRILNGNVAHRISYVLKAPRKAYRLFKWELITADGEVIDKFKQKKDDFRPGEHVTVLRLMLDMHLDQLAIAGGEGTDILRRIKRHGHVSQERF
jgi:hypothetical protein